MTTQADVHEKAQVLLDLTRKLPDAVRPLPQSRAAMSIKPHPLRVAVEQAVCGLDRYNVHGPTLFLRPYDETDPMEPWAWCGRLNMVGYTWTRQNTVFSGDTEYDFWGAVNRGNILAALDAAREAVEEVLLAQ